MTVRAALLFVLIPLSTSGGERSLSFTRDVAPILTKAGCNSGACHGSFQGRGGMSLSLLGYDPSLDYETLFLNGRGRRVVACSADDSLILRKVSGRVPHGGGLRLAPDSEAYQTLRIYISQGLIRPTATDPPITELRAVPNRLTLKLGDKTNLSVLARWSDGETRDVTRWTLFDSHNRQTLEIDPSGQVTAKTAGLSSVSARFLGQVASVPVTIPHGPAASVTEFEPVNQIDRLALSSWEHLGVAPASRASDSTYLRRIYLDLIGVLPTPDETLAFLANSSPDKRTQLVEHLLSRPEYVDLWSLRWSDLLRVHRRFLGDKGVASFQGWIRQSVRENKPLTLWAKELLLSKGNLFTSGPVAYYFIDEKPEELAETTAQVFLGVRLQCTRCHHHPNEVWSQGDYYGLAAYFTRLEKKDTQDQGRFGGARSVRPVAYDVPARQLAMPAEARILGQTQAGSKSTSEDIREDLVHWMIAKDNPFFARNFANRYWAWLMGRGLVEPVDDMRSTNPPSHPEIMDYLEREFVEHDFDPKHLIRLICNSAVYQRDVELAPSRDQDGMLLTHRVPRRLSAEVLLDSINAACGTNELFPGLPESARATELPDPMVASHFLMTFGRPLRNSPCDCARGNSPDLSQALLMLNSPTIHGKLTHPKGRLANLVSASKSDAEIVDELYLAALTRLPTDAERSIIQDLLTTSSAKMETWQDLLWTLLNSAEFTFQH